MRKQLFFTLPPDQKDVWGIVSGGFDFFLMGVGFGAKGLLVDVG